MFPITTSSDTLDNFTTGVKSVATHEIATNTSFGNYQH
ncbi:hypothetical protein FLA_5359 [Filimonas lacunae]|nr:hypothetical protein FLA_5359 [Filimonas lacunae]